MKSSIHLLLILLVTTSAQADEVSSPARKVLIQIRLKERKLTENSTIPREKILAEPTVLALESQSFTFLMGGEVPLPGTDPVKFADYGWKVEGTAGVIKQGKLHLDLTVSLTQQKLTQQKESGENALELQTTSKRIVRMFPLGETKVYFQSKAEGIQSWMEITVQEGEL